MNVMNLYNNININPALFPQLIPELSGVDLSWMTKNVARVGGQAVKSELLRAINDDNASRVREIILEQNLQPLINDTYVVGYSGETLMTSAAEWGASDVLALLVREFGADPNHGDEDGDLPLTTAAFCGHYDAVVSLVEVCGADVFRKKEGQTACDLAKSNGKKRVHKYLVKAMKVARERRSEEEEKAVESESVAVVERNVPTEPNRKVPKKKENSKQKKKKQKRQRKKAKKLKDSNQAQKREAKLSSTIEDQRRRITELEQENNRLVAELEERKTSCPSVGEIRALGEEQCPLEFWEARITMIEAYADLMPDVKRKLEELRARERSCGVCMDLDRTHVAIPCGHRCLCQDCAGTGDVMTCPFCRQDVERWLRVFC